MTYLNNYGTALFELSLYVSACISSFSLIIFLTSLAIRPMSVFSIGTLSLTYCFSFSLYCLLASLNSLEIANRN